MADLITHGRRRHPASSPTSPSSPSSRATAPASTSGPPPSWSSTPPPPSTASTIAWKEVLAGQKAFDETGDWLPDETVETFRDAPDRHQGPADHARSAAASARLNVALRQILDLYVCLRPVRWFTGVPSPVLHPELVDMVIFRENTEDVYAGFEVQAGTPEAEKLADLPARRDRLAHPGRLGHRDQADLARWAPSGSSAPPSTTRSSARPRVGDARPQGQHPEVHRGRLPRTGATSSSARSSPTWPSAGTTATASPATSCS